MKNYNKINDFYIEEEEKALIKHIMPRYYVDHNSIEINYALRFLQNELNAMLGSFVNGGFSYKGYVLHPLVSDLSKENIENIKRLRKIILFLDKNGYDFSSSIRKYKDKIKSKDFAVILSSLYEDYSSIKSKKTTQIKKPECEELDLSAYKKSDLNYLSTLNKLKNFANDKLKQYLLGFYLHGSLATRDYVKGWSDVDTLSIISKKTISNPNALLELRYRFYYMRYFFYKIDPLQHHGSTIMSEYDMENYCQAYFPVTIFKHAKSFFKDDKVSKFNARDFSSEALRSLFWHVSYFRKINSTKFNPGSYETKTLLHYITLFPAIYLQAKGNPMYKKFTFDVAKEDFEKEDWQIIDDISSMRRDWKSNGILPFINLFSRINPLLYYQINSRFIDLFKDIKEENKIDINNIAKEMFKLSEVAWRQIKNESKV